MSRCFKTERRPSGTASAGLQGPGLGILWTAKNENLDLEKPERSHAQGGAGQNPCP
jgi:hypothetical protein